MLTEREKSLIKAQKFADDAMFVAARLMQLHLANHKKCENEECNAMPRVLERLRNEFEEFNRHAG